MRNNYIPEIGTPINWDSDHADGLVAFWPCWDGSNNQSYAIAEELVSGNHAKSTGNIFYSNGELWPALKVTNASNIANFSYNNYLDLPKFTFSSRFYMPAGQGGYKGLFSCNGTNNGFCIPSNGTSGSTYQPGLIINSGSSETQRFHITPAINLPTPDFVHLLWTWDGTNPRAWLNGIEQTTGALGDGGYGVGYFFFRCFSGILASAYDFRIYNRNRPELGTQLYDPSTRWDIFKNERVIRSLKPSGIVLNDTLSLSQTLALNKISTFHGIDNLSFTHDLNFIYHKTSITYNISYTTQLFTESAYDPSSKSNVSQLFVESAYNPSSKSNVSQLFTEVAYTNPSTPSVPSNNALVSQLASEIIYSSSDNFSDVSQLLSETIYSSSSNSSNISQLLSETIYSSLSNSSYTSQILFEVAYDVPSTPSVPSNNALISQLISEIIYNSAYKSFKPNMPPHIFQFVLGQGIG